MTFKKKNHDLVMQNIIMPGKDSCKQYFTSLTICKPPIYVWTNRTALFS